MLPALDLERFALARRRLRLTGRGQTVLIAVVVTLSLTLVATQPLLAAPPVLPMAGELFLTPAERQVALDTMTKEERRAIGHLFAASAPGLLVAYARAEYDVLETPDGGRTVEAVGSPATNPTGNLSIPSHATAASSATGGRSGTALFISMVITRTRSTSPYEWEVYSYAQWGSNGSYWPAGMDCCNNYRDYIGVAWAGGLAIHSDWKNGLYQTWCVGEPGLDIATSKVTANVGLAQGFHEWWDPDNCPMRYGHTGIRIRESTWKNRISNATSEYIHTWGGHAYSVSFSASGPNVSISPTNETWSAPLYVSFAH